MTQLTAIGLLSGKGHVPLSARLASLRVGVTNHQGRPELSRAFGAHTNTGYCRNQIEGTRNVPIENDAPGDW